MNDLNDLDLIDEQSEKFSFAQKIFVALLALTQFTVILDFMIISPLGDFLMKSLNISSSQFGLLVASYAFSAGASGVLTSSIADKFDRKKLLLFFYSGFIIGTFFCAIAPNYYLLLVARIITGLFGGVIGAVSMTIVTDLFSPKKRGRAMGILQMGFSASQVLGIPAGLYINNLFGWRAAFTMIVVLAVLIFIAATKFLPKVNKHLEKSVHENIYKHYKDLFSNLNYRIGFLMITTLSVGAFLIQPFSGSFIINNLKIVPDHLPIIYMVTGMATMFILPMVGKLSDKFDKLNIFKFGAVWSIVMVLVFTNLVPVAAWVIIAVNILLFVGIMSRAIPAQALLMSIPEPKDRGAFMSINSSLQQISGGIAAACAGLVVYQPSKTAPLQHFDILGYIIIMVIILSVFLLSRVSKVVKEKDSAKADKNR